MPDDSLNWRTTLSSTNLKKLLSAQHESHSSYCFRSLVFVTLAYAQLCYGPTRASQSCRESFQTTKQWKTLVWRNQRVGGWAPSKPNVGASGQKCYKECVLHSHTFNAEFYCNILSNASAVHEIMQQCRRLLATSTRSLLTIRRNHWILLRVMLSR